MNISEGEDRVSLVNVAVLSHFFAPDELQRLSGNSLLKQTIEVDLPKLEIIKHSQDAALAADREARYDLQRVSELTKNQSVIYHELADVVAASLNVGSMDLGKPVSFVSWLLDWETWVIAGIAIMAFVSLIISIILGYKVRLLTAAMIMQKSSVIAAQTDRSVIRLSYFSSSTTKNGIENLTSSSAENIKSYSAIEITTLTLLIIVIACVLIYLWRRYKQRNHFYFCIEIGNEKTFERLKCIRLTGSENLYLFMATNFIKSINIRWGIRPNIVIVWPTFCVKHTTLNNIYSFNGRVSVSLVTAWRIHKIIRNKNSFYALPLVERVGKYRDVNLVSDANEACNSRNVVGPGTETESVSENKNKGTASAPIMAVSMLSLSDSEATSNMRSKNFVV